MRFMKVVIEVKVFNLSKTKYEGTEKGRLYLFQWLRKYRWICLKSIKGYDYGSVHYLPYDEKTTHRKAFRKSSDSVHCLGGVL